MLIILNILQHLKINTMDLSGINWGFAIVATIIGFLAAFAELLSRYQNPKQILTTTSSIIYIIINGLASFMAYWYFSGTDVFDSEVTMAIVSGTSALVLLRSSVASIRVGERQMEAGFASILQVFLSWADRSFDQSKASEDLVDIKPIMDGVSFKKAKLSLPTTCFKIMKNVTQEEQNKIANEVAILDESDLDENVKCINLGILMIELTGSNLLKEAIEVLGDSIKGKEQKSEEELLDEMMNKIGV